MYSSSSLIALALAAAAGSAFAADPAPIIQGNQVGNVFQAQLPQQNGSSIKGYAAVQANDNGTGVVWDINFSNLPKGKGPFIYHVHEKPVPADGNCTGAGAHLDPENRGEKPPCDLSQGQKSCQVGDLAGKHGNVTHDPFQVFYNDLYQSMTPGNAAYVGNRSLVIHDNEGNRLTCANFTQQAVAGGEDSGSDSNGSPNSKPGSGNAEDGNSPTSTSSSSTPSATAKQEAATSSAPPAHGAASGLQAPAAFVVGMGALLAAAL